MVRLNCFLMLLLGSTALPFPLSAQVKLAEVSGLPGNLDLSTGLVFRKTGETGFLSNPGSGMVQKFRVSTGQTLGALQLPPGVGQLTLSHDERFLIAAGNLSQKIYIIDPFEMRLLHEGSYPNSAFTRRSNIIVSQDNAKIFIADPARDALAVFDVADGKFDRFINVGVNPNIMTVLPNGRHVAVVCSGDIPGDEESVYLVDTLTLSPFDIRVLTGFNTEPFNNTAFSITGTLAYIPSFNDDRLAVYDLRTFVLASREAHGRGPSKVVSSPDGRMLALVNATSNNIALLSLPEAFLIKDIMIPGLDFSNETMPAFSPDSQTLFIPSPTTGEILAWDLDNHTVRKRIPVGRGTERLQNDLEGLVLTSLDLGSNILSLIALSPRSFNIPHLTQTSTDYSGIAAANFGERGANIAFFARDNLGALLPGTSNPRLLTIPPKQQISQIAAQIFGFNPNATLDGYIEAFTLGAEVTMLYLSGAIDQTRLDGFIAGATSSTRLGFTTITQGVSKFGSFTSTEIILENPGERDANVTIQVYGRTLEGPAVQISFQTRRIPSRNRIRIQVADLVIPFFLPLEKAYVEVTSENPPVPIKGMQIVKIGDSVAMIPAGIRGLPDTIFAATQFASGGAGVLDTPITSYLSLSNSSTEEITVTARVRDSQGISIPVGRPPFVRTLAPLETVFGNATELLGFPDPLADPAFFQGTLELTSDKKGLIASLMFGDARNGRYLTAESLHARTGRKFALVHFAEGVFGEPPKGMFTGLAMFNANRNIANLVIEAYAPDGTFLGMTNVILPRESHTTRTVAQILPAVSQQNGGTIIITSDVPIQLFEVFGSANSDFLVAVEPVILIE